MKKRFTYLLLVLFLVGASAFVVVRYQQGQQRQKDTIFGLKERTGPLAELPEWATVRSTAERLIGNVRRNPEDNRSSLQLAALYLQEARVTGQYAFYDAAALKQINGVLERDPALFEALALKATLQLSQHHFAEGLATARAALARSPYNSNVYGMLVDANVELGHYEQAVEDAQKMVDIRPDLRSFSRIAYLRELHGDLPGATEAMQAAVTAGLDGDEPTSWARVQLGRLYELQGNRQEAETAYAVTLSDRPGYAYALAGLGRLELGRKKYTEALAHFRQAYASVPDPEFLLGQSTAYALLNQPQKAKEQVEAAIRAYQTHAEEAGSEDDAGHYADGELAAAWVLAGEPRKALAHALAEYNRRPKNIDMNSLLAWVYYKKGAAAEALPYMQAALRTKSGDPVLLLRAGLVYAGAGQKAEAKRLLAQGLRNDPNIDPLLKEEASRLFTTL
ncbi:MAG TPA: tetratricopeptide repeat protein [Chitinophagaceae bacterium]|nr:tetratricopeptide repeat protein [Chitinophagaceae bacterium]